MEAKHGAGGLSDLGTPQNGARQGSFDYIEHQLKAVMTTSPANSIKATNARMLLGELEMGGLESFSAHYRADKLFELNYQRSVNFKFTPSAAKLR